jgi:hypothetical protein
MKLISISVIAGLFRIESDIIKNDMIVADLWYQDIMKMKNSVQKQSNSVQDGFL